MRLLFLTPQLPFPPQQGTTIRNYNIVKHLAPEHEISLISFGSPEEMEQAAPLRDLCRSVQAAPHPVRATVQRIRSTLLSPLPDMALRLASTEMHELVQSTLRDNPFDVVQVEGIEMARYMPRATERTQSHDGPSRQPVVFDEHNAEYVLQRSAWQSDRRQIARSIPALYSLVQWKKLARYERRVCSRANHVVTCSRADANAIERLLTSDSPAGFKPTLSVIPNGVDTEYFVPSDEVCAKPLADLSLVFAGKMDYRPNIDAAEWLCREILPRVQTEIPLTHLFIVGQKPTPRVAALRKLPGVDVTGWVPDTRPFVADAAVYVAPLRMGSGTRLKVLEAMAMGKAIVSTTRGVEGIDLQDGRHVVIADSADDLARQTASLLRDPERRRELGRAARELAVSKYDWRRIVPGFTQVYRSIL